MKQLLSMFEWSVLSMGALRLFGGSMELIIAILILYFNDPKKALALNGMLAMVGPVILISTMVIGLAGVASELPLSKFIFVAIGVGCILFGVFK